MPSIRIVIYTPREIADPITAAAVKAGTTPAAEVLRRLARSLRVPFVSPKRGRRWAKK